MLKEWLKQLKNVTWQTVGCLLLLIAILLCLTACTSSPIVVPQQKAQVPQTLLEKASPDAESFCLKVQNFLTRLVENSESAPQTKTLSSK